MARGANIGKTIALFFLVLILILGGMLWFDYLNVINAKKVFARVALEEREKTFNNEVKKYDDRNVNIEQNAKNLASMRPADAVEILNAMEDQDVIDTLRKVEQLAQAAGKMSQVSNWLSLMPPERVATLQRKMTNKPVSLQ